MLWLGTVQHGKESSLWGKKSKIVTKATYLKTLFLKSPRK